MLLSAECSCDDSPSRPYVCFAASHQSWEFHSLVTAQTTHNCDTDESNAVCASDVCVWVCLPCYFVGLLMCKNKSNSDRLSSPCAIHQFTFMLFTLILVKTKTDKTIWLLPPLASHHSLSLSLSVSFTGLRLVCGSQLQYTQIQSARKICKDKSEKSNKRKCGRCVWAWARMQWQSVLQCFNNSRYDSTTLDATCSCAIRKSKEQLITGPSATTIDENWENGTRERIHIHTPPHHDWR